jgi:Lar family restriction alleviation protein
MQNKLLPCPFCGGEASVNFRESSSFIGYFFVSCNECGCRQTTSISKEAVVNAWNTRKPMERIVEQLEDKKWDIHDWRDRWRNEIIDECIGVIKGGVDNEE